MKPATLSEVRTYRGPHGLGVVADLRTEAGRQAARGYAEISVQKDPTCVDAVEAGIEAGMDFIVSLGWTTVPGLFTVACKEGTLNLAFDAAMTRSGERGINQTFWLVVPEEARGLIAVGGEGAS